MPVHMTETRPASSAWAYLRGMESWSVAMHVLLEHAAEAAEAGSIRSRLIGARDDAESLHAVLQMVRRRENPNPLATATIESICSLWDANQHLFEQLAADADPDFHQAWKDRTATARARRHGPPAGTAD